jgi:DNA-binding NarL/FixJ family response regulator
MMVFLAVHVSRTAISSLRLRYIEPPQASGTPAESVRDADLEDHIMARLPAYAAEHSLSKREQEVLKLVIEGRTNHQIATELVLAEGTIKTHLHNIMKKCGQSNREELRRDFWAS